MTVLLVVTDFDPLSLAARSQGARLWALDGVFLEGHMRRREFITLIGATAALPLKVRAQPAKVARIGFLSLAPASALADQVEAFKAGLRDLGYVEGRNIVIEFRWAETVDELLPNAAELVSRNVDVIVAPSSTEVEPARQATKTIPIVFAQHADPVGLGARGGSCAAWREHYRDVDGSDRACRKATRDFN